MQVKLYRVSGKIFTGWTWQKFTLEMLATKESEVIERTYAHFGSKHGLKRCHVKIEEIREISPEEVSRQRRHIVQLLGMNKIVVR